MPAACCPCTPRNLRQGTDFATLQAMRRIRRRHRDHVSAGDLFAAVGGALVGLVVGFVAGASVGRVNKQRLRRAVGRMRTAPMVWTAEEAERLVARVLDALARDVVLARRPIRVQVLGMGLVELTGRVLHASEIGLAGDIVQQVEGVKTVLNHLLVQGVEASVDVPGPKTPRAARG